MGQLMVWLGPENSDQVGPSVIAEGILGTTMIATPQGWCAADTIDVGAEVLTFDAGPQPVTQVYHHPLCETPTGFWPLLVPGWALDNREDVRLLPEQKILIETDLAEDLYGDPFALIPARALEGWRGIARSRPLEPSAAVQVRFAQHQLIYASRGLLLCCPSDCLTETDGSMAPYSTLSLAQAQHLVACLIAEDTGAALHLWGQRQPEIGL